MVGVDGDDDLGFSYGREIRTRQCEISHDLEWVESLPRAKSCNAVALSSKCQAENPTHE